MNGQSKVKFLQDERNIEVPNKVACEHRPSDVFPAFVSRYRNLFSAAWHKSRKYVCVRRLRIKWLLNDLITSSRCLKWRKAKSHVTADFTLHDCEQYIRVSFGFTNQSQSVLNYSPSLPECLHETQVNFVFFPFLFYCLSSVLLRLARLHVQNKKALWNYCHAGYALHKNLICQLNIKAGCSDERKKFQVIHCDQWLDTVRKACWGELSVWAQLQQTFELCGSHGMTNFNFKKSINSAICSITFLQSPFPYIDWLI